MRKGQVAIFVIVAIVLVGALFTSFILYNQSTEEKKDVTEVTTSLAPKVSTMIETCMSESVSEVIKLVGLQGGYYNATEPKTEYISFDVPYYFYEGSVYLPSLNDVASQIRIGSYQRIKDCLDFSLFPEVTVEGEIRDIRLRIGEERILAQMKYPITIKQSQKDEKLEAFEVSIPSDLRKTYEAARAYTEKQRETPDLLCVSCMRDYNEQNDLYADILRENDTLFITLVSMKEENNYVFTFAMQIQEYSCDSIPPNADSFFIEYCLEQELAAYNLTTEDPFPVVS